MGCQRDIASKIIGKKADYILALKGNQGKLCEDVEVFVDEQKALRYKDTTISTHETVAGGSGSAGHVPSRRTSRRDPQRAQYLPL
jgi:predicted transposase YbfD/YdcC